MLNRLKFPLAVLALFLTAAWAPSRLHAQTTDPGQQGEFQGENTDTGAAAVDLPNEVETPEMEASETAALGAVAKASVSAVSSAAAELADAEVPESTTDPDRIEDQVGDQTAPDLLTQ